MLYSHIFYNQLKMKNKKDMEMIDEEGPHEQ